MPFSQNNAKFLKRRKYFDSSSEVCSCKHSFDLETKKVFELKEQDLSHLVSEEKGLISVYAKAIGNTESKRVDFEAGLNYLRKIE